MSEETAKKLAMEVRQSNKSEEFDLSGYGPNSVTKLVQDAFTAPLPLGNMVRLSFVVGGGKKVRQKYNDGLERLRPTGGGVSFPGQAQNAVFVTVKKDSLQDEAGVVADAWDMRPYQVR